MCMYLLSLAFLWLLQEGLVEIREELTDDEDSGGSMFKLGKSAIKSSLMVALSCDLLTSMLP